jgi:hypothetical protein
MSGKTLNYIEAMELPKVWTNIRGEPLQISEMDSSHIRACVFHLASRGLTIGIYPLASIGSRSKHPEAFRMELRRRGDILVNTYGESLAIL